MTIIAEFTTPEGRFGLTDSSITPIPRIDGYVTIFSTHKRRSRCNYNCTTCPLESPAKPCYATPEHFLPKFGITPESHPEYFI